MRVNQLRSYMTMITLTKNCIASRISDNHFNGEFGTHSVTAVNTLVEISRDALRSNRQVAYKGFAKLVPKIKKGGRPVRNPKTGKPVVMKEVATVTMPSSQPTKKAVNPQNKMNTSELINELKNRLKDQIRAPITDIDKLAEATAEEFISALAETETCHVRVEIRGFGVFSAKPREPRSAINPKTLEKVTTKPGVRKHFKVSRPFRTELLSDLKKMSKINDGKY